MFDITEIRFKLVPRSPAEDSATPHVRAYCRVTFSNAFVVSDIKLIETRKGLMVAMPSRKLMDRCPRCAEKNKRTAHYCNDCGEKLPDYGWENLVGQRHRLYADVAHPISSEYRTVLSTAIIFAYYEELRKMGEPGYQLSVADADDYTDDEHHLYH